MAQRRGVPMHVDACVGGFILPFMEMNGVALPRWDYRVEGVTSISADVHKYGFASKGASTITYRHLELLKHQMFVAQRYGFTRPNSHLSSGGLGTMGYSLPAAIGAQFARPNDTR